VVGVDGCWAEVVESADDVVSLSDEVESADSLVVSSLASVWVAVDGVDVVATVVGEEGSRPAARRKDNSAKTLAKSASDVKTIRRRLRLRTARRRSIAAAVFACGVFTFACMHGYSPGRVNAQR
jgi:hypothetical protein